MGIIIYTSDDRKFRQGETVVMHKEMTYPPTAPDTTYILHSKKFTEADCITWAPLIAHRLVIVTDKKPRITDKSSDFVIIDNNLKNDTGGFIRQLKAWHTWADRKRAMPLISQVPLPLTMSFFRVNHLEDIESARLLAQTIYTLPDSYTNAVLAYSVKPKPTRMNWPSKYLKEGYPPEQFRISDMYWKVLATHAPEVQNLIRATDITKLPRGVPKRQSSIVEWI